MDRGRVVGFFESSDQGALDELVARASRLAQPRWVLRLPTVNASLNALCAVLLDRRLVLDPPSAGHLAAASPHIRPGGAGSSLLARLSRPFEAT